MKRKAVVTVITGILLLFAAAAQANPYFLLSRVFNPDGTTGTVATANSYSSFAAFRAGIPGEIGKQNVGPDGTYLEKVYWAYYNNTTTPAYAYTDVGSSDWTTVPAEGDVVTAVMQVYDGQFGWSGGSYVACTKTTISADNISGSETGFSDLTLKLIPAPVYSGSGAGYIDIGWTGIDTDLVAGYTVYRSTAAAGTYTAITYTASQNRNGSIVFTDDGVSEGNTYYYKIAVNVIWGGGNGAPDYFITDARSAASTGIYFGPTPTITPSVDITVSSMTYTPTLTQTITPTYTPSYTETYTLTCTETVTETITPTLTVTITMSSTYTETVTVTLTGSPTTVPNTPTPTITATSALGVNIASEKMVILNSPVKNGRLQLGIYVQSAVTARIFVFNIAGELVYKETMPLFEGSNVIDRPFKKAGGIYILRVYAGSQKIPVKKFAVVTAK